MKESVIIEEMQGNTGLARSEYLKIHTWLKYHYGNAQKCEICGRLGQSRYEWALKKGCSYERKRGNFFELCPSCHRKYDITDEVKQKISKSRMGKPPGNLTAVAVCSVKEGGQPLNFPSVRAAAKHLGVTESGIWRVISGTRKQIKGYQCKRAS
jgi:hypothetical protein